MKIVDTLLEIRANRPRPVLNRLMKDGNRQQIRDAMIISAIAAASSTLATSIWRFGVKPVMDEIRQRFGR